MLLTIMKDGTTSFSKELCIIKYFTYRKDKILKSEAYASSPHQPNVGRVNIIEFIYCIFYEVS